MLDSQIKYQDCCPLCQAPLGLAFFLSTNNRPMPLKIENKYFIISDKLLIWAMSKDSEEYAVDIFWHRLNDQFDLQFRKPNAPIGEEAPLSAKKIEELTQNYVSKISISSFQIQKNCGSCQKHQHLFKNLSLNFETMTIDCSDPATASHKLYLYCQPVEQDEIKFYSIDREQERVLLRMGKMKITKFNALRKNFLSSLEFNRDLIELQLPDFPFEEMAEADLCKRLDTLLLFS
jgi:hypothetical protein